MKRIFIALPINAAIKKQIKKWEKKWRTLPADWLQEDYLHVTVIPPWYENDVDAVLAIVQRIQGAIIPFEILFERICFAPDEEHPRLVWAEGLAPEELLALKAELEAELNKKGEQRIFRLHVTLARLSSKKEELPMKRLSEAVEWRQIVDRIVIMESHPSSDGVEYEVLTEIPLFPKKT